MLRAHEGFQIRHNAFDAFVEDVILGMEDAGVPFRVQNRVLKIFAPMREDIVYR
jgi:hemoglobin